MPTWHGMGHPGIFVITNSFFFQEFRAFLFFVAFVVRLRAEQFVLHFVRTLFGICFAFFFAVLLSVVRIVSYRLVLTMYSSLGVCHANKCLLSRKEKRLAIFMRWHSSWSLSPIIESRSRKSRWEMVLTWLSHPPAFMESTTLPGRLFSFLSRPSIVRVTYFQHCYFWGTHCESSRENVAPRLHVVLSRRS